MVSNQFIKSDFPVFFFGMASITFYMLIYVIHQYREFIFSFASPFPVKKSKTREDLRGHAHDLRGLLLSFCRHPTDMYQSFGPLAEALVTVLKEDSIMHEIVAVSLQVMFPN